MHVIKFEITWSVSVPSRVHGDNIVNWHEGVCHGPSILLKQPLRCHESHTLQIFPKEHALGSPLPLEPLKSNFQFEKYRF